MTKKTDENILVRAAVGLGLALWKTPQASKAMGQLYRNTKDFLSGNRSANNEANTAGPNYSNTGGTAGKVGTNSDDETKESYQGKPLRDIIVLRSQE
jgi:hypothetical protein